MAKIDDIYEQVDDFGLITSAEAAELGMSNAELVQQAARGKLIRVARGVYRMPVWPSQPGASYAIAVKSAGGGAFLFGESVVALLGLAPTNPSTIKIASPKRVRRNLGTGTKVVLVKDVTPVPIEGIPCQPVADAIVSSARTLGNARALKAANEAKSQGIITQEELTRIESELRA